MVAYVFHTADNSGGMGIFMQGCGTVNLFGDFFGKGGYELKHDGIFGNKSTFVIAHFQRAKLAEKRDDSFEVIGVESKKKVVVVFASEQWLNFKKKRIAGQCFKLLGKTLDEGTAYNYMKNAEMTICPVAVADTRRNDKNRAGTGFAAVVFYIVPAVAFNNYIDFVKIVVVHINGRVCAVIVAFCIFQIIAAFKHICVCPGTGFGHGRYSFGKTQKNHLELKKFYNKKKIICNYYTSKI